MLNFDFVKKGLGKGSRENDFSREMFLMLYSINWSNFVACLSLLFEILVNMCIAVVFLTRLAINIYSLTYDKTIEMLLAV